MSNFSDLKKGIKSGQVILFIGSGVSTTLGLPSWSDLLDKIAKELDYDPHIFSILGSQNPLVMAEYYKLIKGSMGPLRSILDREWHIDAYKKVQKSKIHQLITELNFPIIYTTNYDRYIEISFEVFKSKDSYTKIIGAEDLKNIDNKRNQIIKFHGDFDRDDSIVLSESDYFRRLSFEDPLDIKFRSDTLGKSILFIGYSLSDINIRFILYKLSKIWEDIKEPPKSYLFSNNANQIQEKVLSQWNVELLSNELGDRTKSLRKFLSDLQL